MRSLVLAGGGMRLAYQAGVIKALQEAGLVFQHVDGTSGGIFNAAMLLSGLDGDEMCFRWQGLDMQGFVSLLPAKSYFNPGKLPAMGDADGIRDRVFPELGIDIEAIRGNQQLAGSINLCNYSHKRNEAIDHRELEMAHLLAGVSLPLFMPTQDIHGQQYIDAVWIKDANLKEAVRRGAEVIWLVWCIGNTVTYQTGFFHQYVHMIEMSANGGLYEELEWLEQVNRQIAAGQSPYGQQQPIAIHVIKPETPLPLDPALFFGAIDNATLIDMGYADTAAYLTQARPSPPEAVSTAMREVEEVLLLREHYSGRLNLAGRERAIDLHLALHFEQPGQLPHNSRARLTGHLQIDGLCSRQPLRKGVLMIEQGQASLHFRYRFGVYLQGTWQQWQGEKLLYDDKGADMLQDIRTLRLDYHWQDHEGSTELRLDIKRLKDIYGNASLLHGGDVVENKGKIIHYLSMIFGNLLKVYLKPKLWIFRE